MDERAANEPLLSVQVKTTSTSVTVVKWVLKTVMWVVFIAWATLFFFFPANFVSTFYAKFIQLTSGTAFGVTG